MLRTWQVLQFSKSNATLAINEKFDRFEFTAIEWYEQVILTTGRAASNLERIQIEKKSSKKKNACKNNKRVKKEMKCY